MTENAAIIANERIKTAQDISSWNELPVLWRYGQLLCSLSFHCAKLSLSFIAVFVYNKNGVVYKIPILEREYGTEQYYAFTYMQEDRQ